MACRRPVGIEVGGVDHESIRPRALARLREGGWLAPGALAVLETGASEPSPLAPGYTLLDARTWGAAKVWFLQLAVGEG
jgi:hypothetical protein